MPKIATLPDAEKFVWNTFTVVTPKKSKPKKALSYREQLALFALGGEGSGNFGHAGRPGEIGGSAQGAGGASLQAEAERAVTTMDAMADTLLAQRSKYGGVNPTQWKIDGTSDDDDYHRTGVIAHQLVLQRTGELMVERGLEGERAPSAVTEQLEKKLWEGWKGSSSSPLGNALQMAVHEELGVFPTTRLTDTEKTKATDELVGHFTTPKERMEMYPGLPVNRKYEVVGATSEQHAEAKEKAEALAMGRAKAYVRAQWETTQFLLDKAGVKEMNLYRAIIVPHADLEAAGVNPRTGESGPLPNLKLKQNAAASTSMKDRVANSWGGVGDTHLDQTKNSRVVLRFKAPAASVFSLPVFGGNVYEESEVVLMGTKGLQWDAWVHKAPQHWVKPLHLVDKPKPKPKPIEVDLWTPDHWLKKTTKKLHLGGAGSGNFGHVGRPGEIGGSAPGVGAMARLKATYPVVAQNYAEHSGTEMGSIEAHTKDVVREWETQLTPAELAGISDRFGTNVEKLMTTAIPLHDIGKPAALASGAKTKQHEHTVPILQEVLRKEGFGPKDVALATELLNHDLLGPLVRGYSKNTPQQVADTIAAKAQKVGMPVADFAKLQVAFYQADAAAYPYVTQFMSREPSGKWAFRDSKALAPIVALTKPTRTDLGGEGSGNFGHAGRPGEVGGSATVGTKGVKFRTLEAKDREWVMKNSALTTAEIQRIADKKDGGKVLTLQSEIPKAIQQKVFGARDPDEIAGQIVEDLPNDEVWVSWEVGANDHYPESTVMDLYVTTQGTPRIKLGRQFIRHPDGSLTVYHDQFVIPKEMQGKGLAKAVMADSYQTYKELGVDKVETLANLDRGGYAWAKFGFKADNPKLLANLLKVQIESREPVRPTGPKRPKLSEEQQKNLLAVIDQHKDDPRLPWHIAGVTTDEGRKIGRELLYDMSWFGTLNLKDKEATNRLEHYVKGH